MKPLIRFMIFLSTGLFINLSYAACTRTTIPTVQLYTNMGNIVVDPNLNVGDIIAQQVYPIQRSERLLENCGLTDVLNAEVEMASLTNLGNDVFQTNIPGVGIKFERLSNSYPYTVEAAAYNVYLGDSNFIITLIKTANYVGAGALTPGLYTQFGYKPNNNPMLATYISQSGINIIVPSCTIISGNNQNVYLATINRSQLSTVGATAGETPFSIQLKCNGGAEVNVGYDNVNLTFSGEIPTGLTNAQGVLINDLTSSNAAQGIGLQIIDSSSQPLTFNTPYTVGSLANNQNGYIITANYVARYYRYAAQIALGEVESKMIFNITYD